MFCVQLLKASVGKAKQFRHWQSISTGVSAGLNVNVNDAKAVGSKIVEDVAGKSVAEYTPRNANQCILMT